MSARLQLNPDRLFSSHPVEREIARRLYQQVAHLPIVSPHGHTDPIWFARNEAFANPTELLIKPDHYLLRMLYSQGIGLEQLGIRRRDVSPEALAESGQSVLASADPEQIWHIFAEHYSLFHGTPSALWLNHTFVETFGIQVKLNKATAGHYYQVMNDALQQPEFRPRALFDRYNIEVIATTECATDSLEHHQQIAASGWPGKVITAFRPDGVIDPEHEQFNDRLDKLSSITGLDCRDYPQYLSALKQRRAFFKQLGATSTDHGHPTAQTLLLTDAEAAALFARITAPGVDHQQVDALDAERFRAHMLVKMAEMSVEDGLVMQLHPGSYRNHNQQLFTRFGRDKGADIPTKIEYVQALKPLLDRFGNHPDFSLILFTLDETNYSRELAPLAGHYPCLKLGPAWWFHDSPEGMLRFRRQTTETAGFYNTVGFNDDTRAFLSIPARHDVARRMDAVYLAELVARHLLDEEDAAVLAQELAYGLAKRAYKL